MKLLSAALLAGAFTAVSACNHVGLRDDGPAGQSTVASTSSSRPSLFPRYTTVATARNDAGAPISATELNDFTNRYLDLLTSTRFFAFAQDRATGVPQNNPHNRFWYTHWWEYTLLIKAGHQITVSHAPSGSDNADTPTAQVMESACFAHATWNKDELAKLTRGLLRAYVAWVRAGQRTANDNEGPILVRTLYPESEDFDAGNGFTYHLDYSTVRPGNAQEVSFFVHLPANPTFGDVYIKNNRSKDDFGHMMRALAQLVNCEQQLPQDAYNDLSAVLTLYKEVAAKVISDLYAFRTIDTDGRTKTSTATGQRYFPLQLGECDAGLMFKLIAGQSPSQFNCGSGISALEPIFNNNHQNRVIAESHHEAALAWALATGQRNIASSLQNGLGQRLTSTDKALNSGHVPTGFQANDYTSLLIHSMNLGVDLTSEEIRWLHGQIAAAKTPYMTQMPGGALYYDIKNDATPDGKYQFSPVLGVVDFTTLGSLLGACSSRQRAARARPVLNCDLVRQHVAGL